MINHSELTDGLIKLRDATEITPRAFGSLMRLTRGGVHPEGEINKVDWESAIRRQVDQATGIADVIESAKADIDKIGISMPGSKFRFGQASIKEMANVKPELIQIAKLALSLSAQDFIFYDGARSYKEQVALKAAGKSQTLNSKHIIQSDGYGHAMDLVPYINGGPKWDWEGCYKIVHAVDKAATQLGFADKIVWGGAWDRRLSDFGGNLDAYSSQVAAYRARHEGKDFIDGPHYEWRV